MNPIANSAARTIFASGNSSGYEHEPKEENIV